MIKRRSYSYWGVEKHSGGSRDVGIVVFRTKNLEEAKEEAYMMRKQDKRHGYRVIKIN